MKVSYDDYYLFICIKHYMPLVFNVSYVMNC